MAIAGTLALIVLGLSAYGIRAHNRPKFHDLTVELGTEQISLTDFMTEYADSGKVGLVTDPSQIDLNKLGTTSVTLKHGSAQETVTLTVQDTTAPAVEFVQELTVDIDDIPEPEDFVRSVADASATTVSFAQEVYVPKDYADMTVTVAVEDAAGNRTEQDCLLRYAWIQETVAVEYGDTLTKADILLDPLRDDSLLSQEAIDRINAGGLGTYEITSTLGDRTMTCQVTVADTQGPKLELKDLQIGLGGWITKEKFLVSATDPSGVAEVRMVSQPDRFAKGQQTVVIEAEDLHGNITTGEAMLWVGSNDFTPPWISNADEPLTVEKHSTPDYLEGVTATDSEDGACQVVCDSSNVDLDTAGTYYITYRAVDESGNQTTKKRKVIVEHDAEDTAALVESIAAQLSDDPEEIRDYVRSKIYYNHEWGGEDPVWYGFTGRSGNCYVHALCLKAIFDLKGIENQLIWVTNESHYWLIVKIDGGWKHIDPTPSNIHGKYSLMDDAQRLSTLSGRDWDRSKWPVCE